jgi:F0F1-type ATP synthase beta subunit
MLMAQIARNFIVQNNGRVVYLGLSDEPTIQHKEWREFVGGGKHLADNSVHIFAQADDSVAKRQQAVETGLTVAESFRLEGREVLLMIEGQLATTKGVIPYLRTQTVSTPQAAITTLYLGSAPYGLQQQAFDFLDALVVFNTNRANQNLFPALDPQRCRSGLLQDDLLQQSHRDTVARARHCLHHYYDHNL